MCGGSSVYLAYFELIGKRCFDLMDDAHTEVFLKEGKDKNIHIAGAGELQVEDTEQLKAVPCRVDAMFGARTHKGLVRRVDGWAWQLEGTGGVACMLVRGWRKVHMYYTMFRATYRAIMRDIDAGHESSPWAARDSFHWCQCIVIALPCCVSHPHRRWQAARDAHIGGSRGQ